MILFHRAEKDAVAGLQYFDESQPQNSAILQAGEASRRLNRIEEGVRGLEHRLIGVDGFDLHLASRHLERLQSSLVDE